MKYSHSATSLVAWIAAVASLGAARAEAPPPPATAPAQQPAEQVVTAPEAEPEPALYAVPTTRDRVGRVLAPVMINGQGPFRFIVDTGANRSAVSPRVVAKLGLDASSAQPIDVHGVTGVAELPAVEFESLKAGEIELGRVRVPVLSDAVFAGADGILGVDGLQQTRIEVDFTADRVNVTRSTGTRARSGFLKVPARLEHGGLLLVSGKVGRQKAEVIIDTGAGHSLGNLPLRDALLKGGAKEREITEATVIGATPDVRSGTTFLAPPVVIGTARLSNLRVTFGDLHVFEVWNLTDQPALLIGMDMLGRLDRFVVDYGRQEFQLKLRQSKKFGFDNCSVGCGTRVPQD
jgi:predicted aspartyl protease